MKTLSCERHACARPKSPIFWNWVPEYIPDLQKCVGFQNSKKMLNHSTLVYSMVSTTHCKHALAMSVTDLHTVTSTNSSQWCNRLAYTWVNSLPTIIWLPAYNLNLSMLKRMQRYMSGFCLHVYIILHKNQTCIIASAPTVTGTVFFYAKKHQIIFGTVWKKSIRLFSGQCGKRKMVAENK